MKVTDYNLNSSNSGGDGGGGTSDATATATPKTYLFHDKKKAVKALNEIVSMVHMGNKIRFLFLGTDGEIILRDRRDAELALSKYQLAEKTKDGFKSPVSAFSIWLKSPCRVEYTKVVFKPNPADVRPNELNLWQGFAIKPEPGDCSLFLEHLTENICQNNEVHLKFLLDVLAQMIQQPWHKIGICIVLRGGMGVGKSKVSDWLGKIIGARYAPVIDKPDQLTGRFTGQLEFALLARVEEGYYPGDPTSKAAMKHLITGDSLMIERKGLDSYEAPNFTRVLITTNSLWAIPASVGERRYFFLDVGDKRKQDGVYFAAIDAQMASGGAEGFMHLLMTRDISKADFSKPPMTDGLNQQIQLGFTAEEKWLESCLCEGRFPFKDADHEQVEWESEVLKDHVLESYRDFVPGYRGPATPQMVGTFLNKTFPSLKEVRITIHGERVRHWAFPTLADARKTFIGQHPGYEFVDSYDDRVIPMRNSKKA